METFLNVCLITAIVLVILFFSLMLIHQPGLLLIFIGMVVFAVSVVWMIYIVS